MSTGKDDASTEAVSDQAIRLSRHDLVIAAVLATTIAGANDGTTTQLAITAPDGVAARGAGTMPVQMMVNDAVHALMLDARSSLLDVLREQLGLAGAKKGRGHGQCGACTVHLDGRQVVTPASHVRGGFVWGISAALHQESEVDPRFGGFLNANLADYVVACNADVGAIEVEFMNKLDPVLNGVGAKGLGEVAMAGVAPAIVNAVHHATGRRLRSLPIRVEHVV